MIVLNSVPSKTQPSPVENCMNVCAEFPDAISVVGTQAVVSISFYNGEPQIIGELFTFAGVEFEVNTGSPGMGGRYVNLTYTSAGLNAISLAIAIGQHPLFLGILQTVVSTISPTEALLTITWINKGEQVNWDFDFSGLSYPFVYTESNGIDAEYIPGYRMGYKIMSGIRNIVPLQQIPMSNDSDGNILPLCIDIHHDLSSEVYTSLPDCTTEGVQDENIMKEIDFYYGEIQAKESGCGADFVNWGFELGLLIINSAWNIEDGDIQNWWDLYSFNGSNEGNIKFLTTKPSGFKMCLGQCDWLWIVLNMDKFDFGHTGYFSRIEFFDATGVSLGINDQYNLPDGVFIIPMGTGNAQNGIVSPIDWSNICYYDVTVYYVTEIEPYLYPYSETYRVYVDQTCCEGTGVYFLDPKGGYTFLPMDYQEEETFTNEMTEICKDIPCDGTYEELLKGSKFNINSKLTTTIKLKSRQYQKSEELRNLYKAYKASESRFMMKNGQLKRVLAVPEATKIYQNSEYLELYTTLMDAQSFKNQSEK